MARERSIPHDAACPGSMRPYLVVETSEGRDVAWMVCERRRWQKGADITTRSSRGSSRGVDLSLHRRYEVSILYARVVLQQSRTLTELADKPFLSTQTMLDGTTGNSPALLCP